MHEPTAITAYSDKKFGQVRAWWREVCTSNAALNIMSILTTFDDQKKRGCFPSIKRIALMANRSKRSVYRSLRHLETLGLIRRRRRNHRVVFDIVYNRSELTLLPLPADSGVTSKVTFLSQPGDSGVTPYIEQTTEQTTKIRPSYSPAGALPPGLLAQENPEGETPSTPTPLPHPANVRGPLPAPQKDIDLGNRFAVSKHRDVAPDSKQPRRAYTPLDPTLAALMQRFQAECHTMTDDTYSNRNAAKSLLKTYGTIAAVMQAAQRAKSRESTLCRNGERFTLGAVLYYSRKFDKSIDATLNEAERTAKLREMLDDAWQSREFIGFYNLVQVFSVSDEQVQQWYGAEGLVALRRSASDRSANETVEDSQAVC
jgi:hypothetical protein